MKPAVLVENAFPVVLKKAAVDALAVAARIDGSDAPSRPGPSVQTLRTVVDVGAPAIANVPSEFPSRSVITMVTALPSCIAAEAAWAMIVCASAVDRFVAAIALVGGATVMGVPGVGTALRSSTGPPPTCPMPIRTRLLSTPRYLIPTSTSPRSAMLSDKRTTIDVAQG